MLVKILVENFLSFEHETELTMVPSNKTRQKTDHKIDVRSCYCQTFFPAFWQIKFPTF
jgi:hypothetical protein